MFTMTVFILIIIDNVQLLIKYHVKNVIERYQERLNKKRKKKNEWKGIQKYIKCSIDAEKYVS